MAPQCSWDGAATRPANAVKEFIPRPKPGSARALSPNPPPYQHPRVLFSSADRADLVQRALGEDSVVGAQSFKALVDHVNSVLYGPLEDCPVRRVLEALACGESAPGAPGPRQARSEQSPSQVFAALCSLVTDPDDPSKVLRSPWYTQLFAKGLAPTNWAGTTGHWHLVKPGAEDTTPDLGAKYLFCSSEGGIPETRSPIYVALKEAAYVAWIRGEVERLTWLAGVLAMAARVQLQWYVVPVDHLHKHVGGPPGYDRGDDSVCQSLALAYDVLFDAMSEAQRMAPRRLLLTMGKRRVMTGFDAQPFNHGGPGLSHLCTNGTFGMMTSVVLLVQCAVEGERVEAECDEGGREHPALAHDAEAAHFNCEGVKFWLTHGTACDPTGTSRECPGYFGTAMRFATFPTLAAARRGYDIANGSNFYAVLSEILQTSAKWFKAELCLGGHDGTGYCGGFGQSEYFLVVKYMFPDDPLADYVYQKVNTDYKGDVCSCGVNKMPFQAALFGMNVTPRPIGFGDLAKEVSLPLSFFSNARGMGTARSDWADENGTLLYFECRPDMYQLGHGHSNRNDFFVASHGRVWVSGGQYHNTDPEAHSTVLIDGVGQGGSHTSRGPPKFAKMWSHIPGKVVETTDSARLTTFAGDAAAAYTYVNDGPQRPSEKPSGKAPVQTPYAWKDFFLYPRDFGPTLVMDKKTKKAEWIVDHSWAEYKVCAAGEFNRVEYAFRTACLVRGPSPYVLIIDDIKKDAGTHSFTWVANTTIPFASWGYSQPIQLLDAATFGLDSHTDAVFARGEDMDGKQGKPKPGSPLLLLRVLHSAGEPVGPIRLVFVPKGFPKKLDCASNAEYYRMEVERKGCTDPAFKVLLFPFLEGQALPRTTYNASTSEASVVFNNQVDVLRFGKVGNRTTLTLA